MERKISVIGLGYVGLPVAVAFGKSHQVIGFDLNEKRIKELQRGQDHTLEVEEEDLKAADINFTSKKRISLFNFLLFSYKNTIHFSVNTCIIIKKYIKDNKKMKNKISAIFKKLGLKRGEADYF